MSFGLDSTNSTEGPHSPSPSSLNAPRYGTMVPKRIFVGGISASTTEAELHELFSRYGVVTNAKIIADRAGVSKGYGFVTFDSEEDAQRAQASGNNVMLRDRRLNIAPAIKKQPFTRAYDPTQSVPNGTLLYHNGVPYTYHNGMAFFITPETYQYSPTSQAAAASATTSGYPLVYQQPIYYPQHAYQYQNMVPPQWNSSGGQWRWAQPSVSHPAYVYPTAVVSLGGTVGEATDYQDPAIVETGTEVGALGMTPKEDGGGSLMASTATVGLSSLWIKGAQQSSPVVDDDAPSPKPDFDECGTKPIRWAERQLPPRQRRYTAPPEATLSHQDCAQGGERDFPAGQSEHREPGGPKSMGLPAGSLCGVNAGVQATAAPGSRSSWRDCLFGGASSCPPTSAGSRNPCP